MEPAAGVIAAVIVLTAVSAIGSAVTGYVALRKGRAERKAREREAARGGPRLSP